MGNIMGNVFLASHSCHIISGRRSSSASCYRSHVLNLTVPFTLSPLGSAILKPYLQGKLVQL